MRSLALVVVLVGCGGGGDGAAVDAAPDASRLAFADGVYEVTDEITGSFPCERMRLSGGDGATLDWSSFDGMGCQIPPLDGYVKGSCRRYPHPDYSGVWELCPGFGYFIADLHDIEQDVIVKISVRVEPL